MKRCRQKIYPNDNEFKKLRKRACLSQAELAYKIGVSVSTIRRWESGKTEPTMTREQMESFCQAVKKQFRKLPQKLAK